MKKLLVLGLLAFSLVVAAQAQTWDVYGQVRIYNGTCDTGIGMNGVTVILFDTATGDTFSTVTYTDAAFMAAHNLTSPLGIYYFNDVPYSPNYWAQVIPPLGVVLATDAGQGSWWNANPRQIGSNPYRCFLMVLQGGNFSPHTIGYWKHQATVAVTGQGNAQVPAELLQDYLDMIHDLFDTPPDFPISGVTTYNGGPMTPQSMITTFNLSNGGAAGMVNKTKKQLLAMLLNVVSEYVYVYDTVSVDNRTISEVIAFAADMIGPPAGANISTAHTALDYLNNGMIVPAGWIPAGYGLIYYGDMEANSTVAALMPETAILLGNYPNPFNPLTTISFSLPAAGAVDLAIFNLNGREVAHLIDGWREAGSHEVTFDASGLASGVYFCKLAANGQSAITKMMLTK